MSAYHENALQPGFQLAEYHIDSVLGHGGFGITYLAHDSALGAEVAIKEYLPQDISVRDPKTGAIMPALSKDAIRNYQWGLKQFVKEARALARFKHPNIVRVLRFIEANGTAYMVMEYEQGQTLAQHLRQTPGRRLDEPMLLRVVMPLLNGLHAMHEAGLLHLDIKPENIYLRQDGTPMLIDFGSARQAMTSVGASSRIALTHGYAPIEQYPDKGQLGPWSDIYALGATMYRCVTGKRPDDSVDRYRAVLDYDTDPVKPAAKSAQKRYQPMLLDAIDWAMQIHAKDRPQSAREFQDGLMGKRKSADRTDGGITSPPRRASARSAAVRRNEPDSTMSPARAIAITLFIVAALGVGLGLWMGWISNPFEPSADQTPKSAPRSKSPASRPPPQSAPRAKQLPAPGAGAVVHKRPVSSPSRLIKTLVGHADWVQALSFAPDGKQLASAGNDRVVRVWDVASGAMLAALAGHAHPVNALAYAPDGKLLVSVSTDGSVRVWDRVGNGSRVLRNQGYALYAAAFSPDGVLATAGKDRTVALWDLASGKVVRTLERHKADVHALAYSPSGRLLVSGGGDRTVRVWDLVRGEEQAALAGHRQTILALAYSPDGRWLASSDAANTIRIWDAHTLTPVRALTEVQQPVLSLVFSRDGAWLAGGAADNSIYVFDTDLGRPVQVLNGHQGYVQALALSPDGGTLASGSRDGSVRLWQP